MGRGGGYHISGQEVPCPRLMSRGLPLPETAKCRSPRKFPPNKHWSCVLTSFFCFFFLPTLSLVLPIHQAIYSTHTVDLFLNNGALPSEKLINFFFKHSTLAMVPGLAPDESHIILASAPPPFTLTPSHVHYVFPFLSHPNTTRFSFLDAFNPPVSPNPYSPTSVSIPLSGRSTHFHK